MGRVKAAWGSYEGKAVKLADKGIHGLEQHGGKPSRPSMVPSNEPSTSSIFFSVNSNEH